MVTKSAAHCFAILGVFRTVPATIAPYNGGLATVTRWQFSRIELTIRLVSAELETNVTSPIRSPVPIISSSGLVGTK